MFSFVEVVCCVCGAWGHSPRGRGGRKRGGEDSVVCAHSKNKQKKDPPPPPRTHAPPPLPPPLHPSLRSTPGGPVSRGGAAERERDTRARPAGVNFWSAGRRAAPYAPHPPACSPLVTPHTAAPARTAALGGGRIGGGGEGAHRGRAQRLPRREGGGLPPPPPHPMQHAARACRDGARPWRRQIGAGGGGVVRRWGSRARSARGRKRSGRGGAGGTSPRCPRAARPAPLARRGNVLAHIKRSHWTLPSHLLNRGAPSPPSVLYVSPPPTLKTRAPP